MKSCIYILFPVTAFRSKIGYRRLSKSDDVLCMERSVPLNSTKFALGFPDVSLFAQLGTNSDLVM